MFTGLIEKQGIVFANTRHLNGNRLIVDISMDDFQVGESIAINGVCLTLLPDWTYGAAFDLSPETLMLTTLGSLCVGDAVNIERAMLANARFGGHYVSGHVDSMAMIEQMIPLNEYHELIIGGFKACDMLYLVPKGSITVDGVSLTINQVNEQSVHIMLVPHTLAHTTLGQRQVGDSVNIEFDYITRIVAHQLRTNYGKSF